MSRTPLPVVDCQGCGACCETQAGLPVGWYVGLIPMASPARLPDALRAELRETLDAWRRTGFPPDGSPCVWYDPETRRCRHYEYRPDVCREFEVGGEDCLRWREEKGVMAYRRTDA